MTAEEKAKDFLEFIGQHMARLKRNLAKNITFKHDIFEDAFQDTVVRVYDSIIRNNPDIEDYERYFFQASRKWYITLNGKEEKRMTREIKLSGPPGGLYDIAEEEDYFSLASEEELSFLLRMEFGEKETELFMDYEREKTLGRTSYKKFGMELGIPSIRVKEAVKKIKRHLRAKYPGGLTSQKAAEETEKAIISKLKDQFENGLHREEETETAGEETCQG